MEIGIQTKAGPLSQIGVQLFSVETAWHLAVGLHGWWTAKARAESLQYVLSSRNASLVAVQTFSLRAYETKESDFPAHGAARQPGGRFISIILPRASTRLAKVSSVAKKDPGLCCLRAVATALLCFLDEVTTGTILASVLPQYFLHYEQEDVELEKDGPLLPAVQHFVEAVANEESISLARETMLRRLDSQSEQVSSASRADITTGESIDVNEVESLLAWVSVSFTKRNAHVYPTRSFLVWAIAFILEDLGFEIEVSRTVITTKQQYVAFVEKNISASAPTVYFVATSVGPTDPRHVPGEDIQVLPRYRYIPIHAIPAVELRRHLLKEQFAKDKVMLAWKSTFQHVQASMTEMPHIREMMGLLEVTSESRAEPGKGTKRPNTLSPYQHKGIMERSRFWTRSSPESLETLLLPMISKFIPEDCPDCVKLWSSDHPVDSCWSDQSLESEGVPSTHNEYPRLCLNAILLATSYAIACLFLRDGDSPATIDTELVFRPCKSTIVGECFELKDWCENMLSIAAVGQAQKHSTKVDTGLIRFKKSLFAAVAGFEGGQFTSPGTFGCFANGVSMVSLFLLQPLHPASCLAFSKQFGQTLDLPLDDNNLIESTEKQTAYKPYQFPPANDNLRDSSRARNGPVETPMTRWDIEPDWVYAPQNIHFRCRIAGIPKCSLSPRWLQPKLSGINRVLCHQQSHNDARSAHNKPGLDKDEIWSEIPWTQARHTGFYNVRLIADKTLPPHRRHYILVRVTSDEFEQALALTILCDPSLLIQKPVIGRFLTTCLQCGVIAAREHMTSNHSICVMVFVP